MAGYTPVFDSVFHGTLCGRWPTLPVWLTILPMADKNGHIDMTYTAMSALTGWPIDLLKQAIAELMAPDPESRTDANEGRRLELLDPHRSWGWRVVNHEKYREKARKSAYDAERVSSGRDAERKRAERAVPRCPAPSRAVPLSDSDSDSDSNTDTQKRAPEVPHGTPEASEAEIFAAVSTIKSHYPKAARENWIGAERTMRQLVGDRLTTWPELLAGVERYAAHVKATGRQVLNPANFFGAEDRPYSQAWPIPAAKPGTNGGTDPEAAAAWSRLLAADGANRTVRDQFALDAIGGWSTVRLRTAFDEPKIRANFCRAWSEAA